MKSKFLNISGMTGLANKLAHLFNARVHVRNTLNDLGVYLPKDATWERLFICIRWLYRNEFPRQLARRHYYALHRIPPKYIYTGVSNLDTLLPVDGMLLSDGDDFSMLNLPLYQANRRWGASYFNNSFNKILQYREEDNTNMKFMLPTDPRIREQDKDLYTPE